MDIQEVSGTKIYKKWSDSVTKYEVSAMHDRMLTFISVQFKVICDTQYTGKGTNVESAFSELMIEHGSINSLILQIICRF